MRKHDAVRRQQKSVKKMLKMSLRTADTLHIKRGCAGWESLKARKGFKQYPVYMSYFPFDRRYLTSPRKLGLKGKRTRLYPPKSYLRTRWKLRNHYLLRQNDVTSISQGNVHISKEDKFLMCSHLDSCSKERFWAGYVREQHISAILLCLLNVHPGGLVWKEKRMAVCDNEQWEKASSLLAINSWFDFMSYYCSDL